MEVGPSTLLLRSTPLQESPQAAGCHPACGGTHRSCEETPPHGGLAGRVPGPGAGGHLLLSSKASEKPGQPPGRLRAGRGVPSTRTLSSRARLAGLGGVGLLEGVLGEVTPRFVGKGDVNQAGSSCKHISLETENQSLPGPREEWMRGGKGRGHGGRRGQAPRVRATPGTVGDLTPGPSLRPLCLSSTWNRTLSTRPRESLPIVPPD